MKKVKKNFIISGFLFILFCLFTAGVKLIDVLPIGPQGSSVGFSTLNEFVLKTLGESQVWYDITSYLGVLAIFVAFCFCILGLLQFIKRKNPLKIDKDIIFLGAFYVLVILIYIFFEKCIVNYRPVILETSLEASYPSSHTMIVTCITASAIIQLKERIKNKSLKNFVCIFLGVVMVVTIIGRMLSGVHWFTDIIGGLILSSSLIELYYATFLLTNIEKNK